MALLGKCADERGNVRLKELVVGSEGDGEAKGWTMTNTNIENAERGLSRARRLCCDVHLSLGVRYLQAR